MSTFEVYNAEMRERRAYYMDNYGQGDDWQEEGARLHHGYYSWVADYIGATVTDLPVDRLRILASCDPHFNDIDLKVWDRCHGRMLSLARARGVSSGWSNSDTVCTLKAIAKRIRNGEV